MSVDKNLHRIIQRLQGKLPEEANEDLDRWLTEPTNSSLEQDVKGVWSMTESYKQGYEPDVEKGLMRFKARIAAEEEETTTVGKRFELKKRSNWWAQAAAIALVIGLGLTYYFSSTSQVEMMAVTTQIGERKEIKLSDGSTVILNEDSKLVFPTAFGDLREVRLSGEAYFSITPDPEHPFSIDCPNAHVEVLGTSFNLRAYPQEAFAEVEVESGKVKFSDPTLSAPTVLGPKQMARVEMESADVFVLKEEDVPALNAQAWRTNRLDFRKMAMHKVIDLIERYYGASIEFGDTDIKNCSYNSTFEKDALSTVLSDIELGFGAKIKKIGPQKYRIDGGGCKQQ